MGIKTVETTTPREALFPTGTPAELKAAGHDLRNVHSCAIPMAGRIRGCPRAEDCAARKFGLVDDGGFGPQSLEPGTPGTGPKNVGYYLETQEGDSKEDWIRCSAYMTVLFDRDMKQEETGEVIMVVAQEGEEITMDITVPEDPKLCNRNGNLTMITTPQIVPVPRFRRPHESDRKGPMREKLKATRMERIRNRRLKRAGYGDQSPPPPPPPPPATTGEDTANGSAQGRKVAGSPRPLPGGKPVARRTGVRKSAVPTTPPAGNGEGGDGS